MKRFTKILTKRSTLLVFALVLLAAGAVTFYRLRLSHPSFLRIYTGFVSQMKLLQVQQGDPLKVMIGGKPLQDGRTASVRLEYLDNAPMNKVVGDARAYFLKRGFSEMIATDPGTVRFTFMKTPRTSAPLIGTNDDSDFVSVDIFKAEAYDDDSKKLYGGVNPETHTIVRIVDMGRTLSRVESWMGEGEHARKKP